jgi:folate-binding Fe-S cluster repair protein YgfZ
VIINLQMKLSTYLSKYKLRSKIEIKDISTNHVIGLISLEKFRNTKNEKKTLIR